MFPYSFLHKPLDPPQHFRAVPVMKISRPTTHDTIDLTDYIWKRDRCPSPVCQFFHSDLNTLNRPFGWLYMRIKLPASRTSADLKTKAKEIKTFFISIDNRGLLLVESKITPVQNHLYHLHRRIHTAFTEYDKVVGISHKSSAISPRQIPTFPYPVEYMKVQVRQEWRDYAPLWCAKAIILTASSRPALTIFLFNDWCLEPLFDQCKNGLIIDSFGYNCQKFRNGE